MDNGSAKVWLCPGALLAGNNEAEAREDQFAAPVLRRSRFVFRVAFSVLRDPHDAEEVVQETFLRLYRNSAWTEMRDEQAFLARAAWRGSRSTGGRASACGSSWRARLKWPGPEATALRTERVAAVHQLIDGLPEELRQPLALSTLDQARVRASRRDRRDRL